MAPSHTRARILGGAGLRTVVGGTVLALGGTACLTEANQGIAPPRAQFFFPQGLALDPRVSTGPGSTCLDDSACTPSQSCAAGVCRERSRWLFVANANSDLRYNAGTVVAVDLDAFLEAARGGALGPDQSVDPKRRDRACRRLPSAPQTVECTEEPFIDVDATVFTGDYASALGSWYGPVYHEFASGGSISRAWLLALVRGDPSITYMEVLGGRDGLPLRLECDQDDIDGNTCADPFKMRRYQNEEDGRALAREPTSIAFAPDGSGTAYVAHSLAADVTLLNLNGLAGNDRPAIVDQEPLMLGLVAGESTPNGGYGLAVRPCDPATAPNETLGCTRPLVYAGFRFARFVNQFSSVGFNERDPSAGSACVQPELEPTTPVCSQRLISGSLHFNGTLDAPLSGPTIGGMAFSRDGNELYIAQTTPSALHRMNTSLDEGGSVINVPSGTVEVCPEPSALSIYEAASVRYGLVTCYRNAMLFITDLDTMSVVAAVRVGAGPHQLIVDHARELTYVANTLDATLSVVDLSSSRPSRLTEIARLGLQEPFST